MKIKVTKKSLKQAIKRVVKDNPVFPNLGKNIGDVLRKQGGLAKSILPFKGPKPTTQKKWNQKHFGKRSQ